MAISTAAFPRMAEEAVRDQEELKETLSKSLRVILYLTIPASVALMVLARPLTSFLLQGGAFDAESADLVVPALVFYAVALFAHAGIEILSRGFYALEDTRTPVTFAVISMAVNLLLSAALVIPFGIRGLAAALSVAAIVEFALLVRTLARRLRGLDNARVLRSVARTLIATVLMAEVIALWLAALNLVGLLDLDNKLDAGLALVGGTALGGLAFLWASRVLHSEEAETLLARVQLPQGVRRLTGG
jgi:putative peptidoglycan lipid II flippase